MQSSRRLRGIGVLALLCASAAHAQDEQALKSAKQDRVDSRLSSVLEASGIAFATLDSGDLAVEVPLSEGRTQSVVLRSKTHAYRREEWRELFSVAFQGPPDTAVAPELLTRLLADNNELALGAWALVDGEIRLVLRLPARSSPLRVREAIDFAAEVADGLELELEAAASAP